MLRRPDLANVPRFKKDMWEKIAKEMQLPWRAAEAMHWQIGEVEMAHRANVAVFHLAGTNSSQPSAPNPSVVSEFIGNSPSPNLMSKSLPSLHHYPDHGDSYARYDTRAPTPSHNLLPGAHGPGPEEYADYRGRPSSRSGLDMYQQQQPPHRYPSPYSSRPTDNGHSA